MADITDITIVTGANLNQQTSLGGLTLYEISPLLNLQEDETSWWHHRQHVRQPRGLESPNSKYMSL